MMQLGCLKQSVQKIFGGLMVASAIAASASSAQASTVISLGFDVLGPEFSQDPFLGKGKISGVIPTGETAGFIPEFGGSSVFALSDIKLSLNLTSLDPSDPAAALSDVFALSEGAISVLSGDDLDEGFVMVTSTPEELDASPSAPGLPGIHFDGPTVDFGDPETVTVGFSTAFFTIAGIPELAFGADAPPPPTTAPFTPADVFSPLDNSPLALNLTLTDIFGDTFDSGSFFLENIQIEITQVDDVSQVPLPASLPLLVFGALSFAAVARRKSASF
ncbi:MAG: VPLPA-CTERM sorting domain-containing protein [Paracoccaceae bacterium]